MAKIIKQNLFTWQEIDAKSDLNRLTHALKYLSDEELMENLEDDRRNGRNDYPIRAIWNSIIAGIVYQHKSIEELRRELQRNGELRNICGFDPFLGSDAVPTASAYSNFLNNLIKHTKEIEDIFNKMLKQLTELLPDFGRYIACDSKAIDSHGKPTNKDGGDNRRDVDADWGVKKYSGIREDGRVWEKIKKWFGYKLHLLIDSKYELPIAYAVTRASASDSINLLPLVEDCKETHPKVIERAEYLSADKGYDSENNIKELYDEHGIKPIIDIRNMWEEEDLKIKKALFTECADNIVYDYKSTVYCQCPSTGCERGMSYKGFEKDRMTLKYECPAKAYGLKCKGARECSHFNKSIRIDLDINRRMFTPLARSSYAWKREYNRRSAIERVNSRLDVSFGWEKHFIRGQKKMEVRMGISLIVMLSMAVGHIKEGRSGMMRSLIKPLRYESVEKLAA